MSCTLKPITNLLMYIVFRGFINIFLFKAESLVAYCLEPDLNDCKSLQLKLKRLSTDPG